MADKLSEAELALFRQQVRLRLGFVPISSERGLELFDAACARPEPMLAPVEFAGSALRDQATGGTLPSLLKGLVRTPIRRTGGGAAIAKLAALPEAERAKALLDLVLAETAVVLGHETTAGIEPARAFKDLGFDSLAAVELRNRLNAASGLRLPSTLVFDHPTPRAVAISLNGAIAAKGDRMSDRERREIAVRNALLSVPVDHLESAALLRPLLSLAAVVNGTDSTGPYLPNENGLALGDSEIESASDDELFQLIDKEAVVD
jgi:acyl carrier protein